MPPRGSGSGRTVSCDSCIQSEQYNDARIRCLNVQDSSAVKVAGFYQSRQESAREVQLLPGQVRFEAAIGTQKREKSEVMSDIPNRTLEFLAARKHHSIYCQQWG
jgi:hypothetical protein